MKLFPFNRNYLALVLTTAVTIGLFVSGLLEILDYFIVKVLLFIGFGILFITAIGYGIKNDKKNRPEDQLQDDSH